MTEQPIAKVIVDPDLCIGSANCVAIAPDVFDLDEDGKAVVKPGANLADVAAVLDAVRSCPVNAIKAYDAAGNEIQ